MKSFDLLHNLRIRYKLFFSYTMVFILTIMLGSIIIYSIARKSIESNIESELKNSTNTILNMVRTSAAVSLKNYFRAVAEKNREVAAYFYLQYQNGILTEQEAKQEATDFFLGQMIGKSGYIYCIDTKGVIRVHPQEALVGVNISGYDFAREQKKRKNGYLEYDWKNPGEESERPKALFMSYFEQWDWIISVTSYREEFSELVKIDDFRESILSLRFGHTGYSYVMDLKGKLIIHPELEGENIINRKDADGRLFIQEVCRQKKGKIIYPWKNPHESAAREKLVIFNHIPEYNWIVFSSGYLDELYAPLNTIKNAVFFNVVFSILLLFPISLMISSSITNPLRELMTQISSVPDGDFSLRIQPKSHDEVGRLTMYFNTFMERLQSFSNLDNKIMDISEKERRKIGQDLHDDLCPHLIGIEVLTKVLQHKLEPENPDLSKAAKDIRKLIKDAISKTRGMSRGLCPIHLVEHGFEFSIKEMARNTEHVFGISCVFKCSCPVFFYNNSDATHLFYIIQEGVYNAIKHGKASRIIIDLSLADNKMVLQIIDDGCKISDVSKAKGMGLKIMGFRAKKIGAEFDISPNPGKGTTITIKFNKEMPKAEIYV